VRTTAESFSRHTRSTALRWLKFNAVGGLGIAVQLALLLTLKTGFNLNYMLATLVAVEGAIIHNFFWHERYTWADRVQSAWKMSWLRFLRFNLTTGVVSIGGNLAVMRLMVGLCHLNYLVANGIAIAMCSIANFLASEHWVFRRKEDPPDLPDAANDSILESCKGVSQR
jgi:putative flippase GtrA